MAADRTESLIAELVVDLEPVRPLAPISSRVGRWLVAALVIAAGSVWFFGARADISRALLQPVVLFSLGLALAICATAALSALRLSIPGNAESTRLRGLPFAFIAVWAAALVVYARSAGVSWPAAVAEPFHAGCVVRVLAIAILPALVLVREVRRGFAFDARPAVALAALGGSAAAAIAVQLICPIDRPAHLLVSHLVPMAGFALGAGLIAHLASAASNSGRVVRRR
jgi:hypothetical protein